MGYLTSPPKVGPKARIIFTRESFGADAGVETDEQRATSRRAASSWSAEEDDHLLALIAKHGETDWATRAKDLGTNRTAKACQTRYRNHLRFRSEEEVSGKRKLAAESNTIQRGGEAR